MAGAVGNSARDMMYLLGALITGTTFLSLLVSLYVYDISDLYDLPWIEARNDEKLVVNINAGFDETSERLQGIFAGAELVVFDFYDPNLHTEVSIKRARKAYPATAATVHVSTSHLPLAENSADKIFVIFAAHEVRNSDERTLFCKELARIVRPNGRIYLTEHLRDGYNFLAYTLGFFHFYPRKSWLQLFENSGLAVEREVKCTPFVTTFILRKHGITH